MKELDENMSLSECLKNFDFEDIDFIGMYLVANDLDRAQWLSCKEPCIVHGHEIKKDDLLLLDNNSGQIVGMFTPFEQPVSTQNNKQEH